jgi:hypothetical protein
MPRRKLPTLNPCKVDLKRLRKLSSDQLMSVWARLGASRVSRTHANSLLKGIVSNYAAAKVSQRVHKDLKMRRMAMKAYVGITRRLEAEFRELQGSAACSPPRRHRSR